MQHPGIDLSLLIPIKEYTIRDTAVNPYVRLSFPSFYSQIFMVNTAHLPSFFLSLLPSLFSLEAFSAFHIVSIYCPYIYICLTCPSYHSHYKYIILYTALQSRHLHQDRTRILPWYNQQDLSREDGLCSAGAEQFLYVHVHPRQHRYPWNGENLTNCGNRNILYSPCWMALNTPHLSSNNLSVWRVNWWGVGSGRWTWWWSLTLRVEGWKGIGDGA